MLLGFPSLGFVNELTSRFQMFSRAGSGASVEGCGQQAVVVAAADRIYKVFATSSRSCGVTAHGREVAALKVLGGYEGQVIRTPALKSHRLFESPFEFFGKNFVGLIEQTRMEGVKPRPQTSYQYGDIGGALGEFHALLDQKAPHLTLHDNTIDRKMRILKSKDLSKKAGHALLPGLRKRILSDASKLALDTALHRHVHGDFHMGNVIFDGQKFAIIDFALMGKSVLEEDMTGLVSDKPEMLKEVFKGYAQYGCRKPSHSRVMTLYSLDMAIATEYAHANGRPDQAQKLGDRLQAVMS